MLENDVKEKQPKQDFSLPENVMSIVFVKKSKSA